MDLVFNELCLQHPASDKFTAHRLMKLLLDTCKACSEAGKPQHFKKLRVSDNFKQLALCNNYKIVDWLQDPTVTPTFKSLFLSLARTPFIVEGDDSVENRFCEANYYLNLPTIQSLHDTEPEGLTVAFLYNTLALSLSTHAIWAKTQFELRESIGNTEKIVAVRHMSCSKDITVHQAWIEENCPIHLVPTNIPPENKTINLRDDHGKDVLSKFAQQLLQSPYVVKVINSLPFNPKDKQFIKGQYRDGKIEIVLTWTDEGFGLVIQTTGKSLQETTAIADMLEKKYRK